MTKPTPKTVDPEDLVRLAHDTMEQGRFPFLATTDGVQPRLRPVSLLKTEGFVTYFANLRQYHKTAEIAANPKVELCFMDADHNQVRITGVAEIVSDKALIQEIWEDQALLRQYLGSVDNPELIIYRIRPNAVRYMREWALTYWDVPIT